MSEKVKKIAKAVMITVLSAGIAGVATQSVAAPKMQKCYGVVKAGKNDCGTPKHACAAQATKSGNPQEWIYLLKGTCTKLVGGSLKPSSSSSNSGATEHKPTSK